MHRLMQGLGAGWCALLGACASAPSEHHVPTAGPPGVIYARPAAESLQKIMVERFAWSDDETRALAGLPRQPTRFGERWIIEQRPDTMEPPPWTTRLYILPAADAREGIRIELRDHASYGVEQVCMSEKLLFLRVWWGRIVTTDAVLDLETLRFAYIEDANYTGVIYPQANPDRDH